MSDATTAALVERLRYVLANMHDVLASLASNNPPTADVTRVRIERWVLALESIVAQGEPPALLTMKQMLVAAINGADIAADATVVGLRDLTQLAAALRPGRTLAVSNADVLNPIARASISTAATGHVTFDS